MLEKIKQFKNLILLVLIIAVCTWANPTVFFTRKAYERAQIENRMRIEAAETEHRIAIIKAQTEAELRRIWGENGKQNEN